MASQNTSPSGLDGNHDGSDEDYPGDEVHAVESTESQHLSQDRVNMWRGGVGSETRCPMTPGTNFQKHQ